MTFSPVEEMSLDLNFTTHPKDLGTVEKWLQIEKKHSGSNPDVKSHGRRRAKQRNSQQYHGQMLCKSGRKKGSLQEFLAFEGPCTPNKRSESLALLFRIIWHETGCVIGKGPSSGGR